MAKKKTKSKYHVDISDAGKKARTYKGVRYDSLTELRFLQEYIEPRMETGEIKSYERQVTYILQEGFKKKDGTKVLPIKYISDFNVVWADNSLTIFDVKGNPDSLSKLKKKIFEYKYRDLELVFICRNLKYAKKEDDGWIEYDLLKKLRREDKKKQKGV